MLVNALLVRWQGGYIEVEDAASIATYGRCEGFLSLGNVPSAEQATVQATAILNQRAAPQVSVVAGVEPTGVGDVPLDDFGVGDSVTAPNQAGVNESLRVKAVTVTEDAEGNPVFAPELSTVLEETEAAYARWLKRMANGTLHGTIESASPATTSPTQAPQQQGGGLPELPPFSFGGALTVSTSGRYYPPINVQLTKMVVSLGTAGSTSTTVVLRKNGAIIGTATVGGAAGNKVEVALAVSLQADTDYLSCSITAVGTGATDLVVQPRTSG